MQKLLVPVLVLAIVALSSSNFLPTLSMNEENTEPLGFNYQDNDNTFSYNQQTKNEKNAIFFNIDVEPDIEKIPQIDYSDNNEDIKSISKDNNYNVKGFRKEQWHNYPRQLDRLNRYFYEHQSTDKRNLDPDDPGNAYSDESVESIERNLDEKTPNKFHLEHNSEPRINNNEAEIADAVINPLLIFRIHLSCFKAINQPRQLDDIDLENDKLQEPNKEEHSLSNELNPGSNQIKVKREDNINLEDVDTALNTLDRRTMNKRIFSLWSRLQSLNPKSHQLHHRRHLYALYGLPDSEGGGSGVLTAETRATFMRPPGSPLRWG